MRQCNVQYLKLPLEEELCLDCWSVSRTSLRSISSVSAGFLLFFWLIVSFFLPEIIRIYKKSLFHFTIIIFLFLLEVIV